MAKLGKRLRFDLPDPLPGHPELAPDFLQRPRMAVDQAEPQLDDLCLPFGQRVQDGLQLFLQQDEAGRVDGHHRFGVFDEVAEVRVLFLADRRLERHGLL